jgi:nucleolar protein 14
MADFSEVLVEHLSYMGVQMQPLSAIEQVVRHLHSLSRTYPERIASAFRDQLQSAHHRKELHAGDFVILTAIGSIYPTSDHFHQIVTPAITLMARWLGMSNVDDAQTNATGAYLVALALDYQRLSKRYVPEAMMFTRHALKSRLVSQNDKQVHLDNLIAMGELWKDKPAFVEIFQPALPLIEKLGAKKPLQTLQILLHQSRLRRRPLELHHHRPLPIRTSIPKFEDNFDPDKHYDPDKERSDAKKLQREYKRERKGALRELRKDANFVARQQLQEKKARDAEYEKKYRRLVAEIQGQEGHDAKEYEREKRARKRQK